MTAAPLFLLTDAQRAALAAADAPAVTVADGVTGARYVLLRADAFAAAAPPAPAGASEIAAGETDWDPLAEIDDDISVWYPLVEQALSPIWDTPEMDAYGDELLAAAAERDGAATSTPAAQTPAAP